MASSILSEPHPPRDVISVWNLLGLEGLILIYSQYKDRLFKTTRIQWKVRPVIFRGSFVSICILQGPCMDQGSFTTGWGAGNSDWLEAENHPIEKENHLRKKNSMGSTVDFSGEYRQKHQIQWFSPMSKGFYLLGIHHIEDSDRWQAGLQCRVNMRDPKSKGKFF